MQFVGASRVYLMGMELTRVGFEIVTARGYLNPQRDPSGREFYTVIAIIWHPRRLFTSGSSSGGRLSGTWHISFFFFCKEQKTFFWQRGSFDIQLKTAP